MASFKNDGTLKFGSRTLVIGSGAGGTTGTQITCTTADITFTIPTAHVERKDSAGATDGQVSFYSGVVSFSTVLDYPTSSSIPPQLGWETTTTFRDSDASGSLDAEVFYLAEMSIAEAQEGLAKMNVVFRKKIN